MAQGYEPMLSIYKNPEGDLHLEPCPFCGENNAVYWEYGTPVGPRWKIFCLGCTAGVDPGYAQQKHQITDIWNRRALKGIIKGKCANCTRYEKFLDEYRKGHGSCEIFNYAVRKDEYCSKWMPLPPMPEVEA